MKFSGEEIRQMQRLKMIMKDRYPVARKLIFALKRQFQEKGLPLEITHDTVTDINRQLAHG